MFIELIDKQIKKGEFYKVANISTMSISKLLKSQIVAMDIVVKI